MISMQVLHSMWSYLGLAEKSGTSKLTTAYWSTELEKNIASHPHRSLVLRHIRASEAQLKNRLTGSQTPP